LVNREVAILPAANSLAINSSIQKTALLSSFALVIF